MPKQRCWLLLPAMTRWRSERLSEMLAITANLPTTRREVVGGGYRKVQTAMTNRGEILTLIGSAMQQARRRHHTLGLGLMAGDTVLALEDVDVLARAVLDALESNGFVIVSKDQAQRRVQAVTANSRKSEGQT
jgi:hypothetical protein